MHKAQRRLPPRRRPALAAAGLLALLMAPATPPALAQSACDETGPAAAVVCRDPTLSSLSRQLSETLKQLIGETARQERRALIREQRDWAYTQRDCLLRTDAANCLVDTYESRISTLSARLPSDVAGFGQAGNGFGEPGTGLGREETVESSSLPPLGADGGAGAEDTGEAGASATETAALPAEASESTAPRALAASPGGSGDGDGVGAILTGTVWKADIATGVRPGTIFVFQKDGALVTADCVDSYKLGSWSLSGDAEITLDDGAGSTRNAEVVSAQNAFVRLRMAGSDNRGSELVLRPALAPFSCKSG